MQKMVSLDEAIRVALIWDANRVCTPESAKRILNGFCDKLMERQIEPPEVAERIRRSLLQEI